MQERILTAQHLEAFRQYLLMEEKSEKTIEQYLRFGRFFAEYAAGRVISRELVLAYKHSMMESLSPRSVNARIAALGSLFTFLGWQDCRVKSMRLQQEVFQSEAKELSKSEYLRLVEAAKGNRRLYCLLQTICATGIRVSELQYFTVEAVRIGTITVRCKNKIRNIFVPGKLKSVLLKYAKHSGITSGVLFRTRNGKPLDRSNIWAMMKKLCHAAEVDPQKVFPHNLRKLFARLFYAQDHDISKLADLLGHSNIMTTRIYIMTTGREHRRKIERLGLIV